MARHNEIGVIGEEIARRFLEGKGFSIVNTNYRKKWGEIDIIAEKEKVLRFIEVKTVSTYADKTHITQKKIVNHETGDEYKPEDNVTHFKAQRLMRAIQSYLSEKQIDEGVSWQLDIVAITLNAQTKEAKVKFLENITV